MYESLEAIVCSVVFIYRSLGLIICLGMVANPKRLLLVAGWYLFIVYLVE